MKEKIKLLVILGPTASGKSDLAVELAHKFDGEIISADSRQVYKGLDIGTGKITVAEMKGIPHHLLDVADPSQTFSVQDFQDLATKAIEEIHSRDKLPILCGGTGFYIDAVVDGIVLPDVQRDEKLRSDLDQKSSIELFEMLKKMDGNRAEAIGPNNRPRLIRAIEIAKKLGTVPKLQRSNKKYDVLKIGIKTSDDELKRKISARLNARLENGMLDEAKKLSTNVLSYKRMFALGLEYRYMSLYLQDKISHEEMVERLNIETWQYAKRQMQWWKRDKAIEWLPLEEKEGIFYLIHNFLIKKPGNN
jgi:tRNA dimethylallyltransferase